MCIFSLRDSYNGKNNYEWHKFTNFFFEDELKTYILNKYSDITEEEVNDWVEKSRSGISELRISSKKVWTYWNATIPLITLQNCLAL